MREPGYQLEATLDSCKPSFSLAFFVLSNGFQSQSFKFSLCPRLERVGENWKYQRENKQKNLHIMQVTSWPHFFLICVFYIWSFIWLQEFNNPFRGSKQNINRQSCFAQLVWLLLPAGMCNSEKWQRRLQSLLSLNYKLCACFSFLAQKVN